MLYQIAFVYGFLLSGVLAQELGETQSPTATPTGTQEVDWDQRVTKTDHTQLRKSTRYPPNTNYELDNLPFPSYGERIKSENDSVSTRGFTSESEDNYRFPAAYPQMLHPNPYVSNNGMLSLPQMLYPPRAFNPRIRDHYGYVPQINTMFNPYQEEFRRMNISESEIFIGPTFADARVYRPGRFPYQLRNMQNSDSFISPDIAMIYPNQANPLPVIPYLFSPHLTSPYTARTDKDRVDIFVRPPEFDRESGSDKLETAPLKTEIPEVPTSQQTDDSKSIIADASVAEEQVINRYVPNPPLTFPTFPYGIPPPEITPFTYPAVPPTIPPPLLPPIPLPANDNLLNSVLRKPLPVPAVPGDGAVLPSTGDGTPISSEMIPSLEEEFVDNNAKIPYQFGYEMNDGRGTDQHRKEEADGNGSVTGSYSYRDPFGVYRVVNYIADKNGFRAFIQSNEPGVANPGSADVTVVAEVPPLKAIAEGLRTLKLETVPVSDEPVEPIVEVIEKK